MLLSSHGLFCSVKTYLMSFSANRFVAVIFLFTAVAAATTVISVSSTQGWSISLEDWSGWGTTASTTTATIVSWKKIKIFEIIKRTSKNSCEIWIYGCFIFKQDLFKTGFKTIIFNITKFKEKRKKVSKVDV